MQLRWLFAVVLAASAASCSLVVDTSQLSGGNAPGSSTPCTRTIAPAIPSGMDSGSIEFIAALRSLNLGENSTDISAIGWDVDGLCTCPDQTLKCKNPVAADFVACDGEGGVDNTSSEIAKALLTTDADFTGSAYYSQGAELGFFTLLFQIKGYNGMPSDPKVSVAVFESPGFMPMGMNIETPAWTGQEAWSVSSASLQDGNSITMPVNADENAYVRDGVLVASFNTLAFSLAGEKGHVRISLQNARVSAQIAAPPGNTGYRLEKGLISGIFPESDVFRALSTFFASGDVLCNDGGFFYEQTKKALCHAMDVNTQMPNASGICNASSFGMSFETFPAAFGNVTNPIPRTSTCPAGQDPQLDQCAN